MTSTAILGVSTHRQELRTMGWQSLGVSWYLAKSRRPYWKWHLIIEIAFAVIKGQINVIVFNYEAIAVSADGLAPVYVPGLAGTVMTNFMSRTCISLYIPDHCRRAPGSLITVASIMLAWPCVLEYICWGHKPPNIRIRDVPDKRVQQIRDKFRQFLRSLGSLILIDNFGTIPWNLLWAMVYLDGIWSILRAVFHP